MRKTLEALWHERTERERAAIAFASLLVGLAFAYAYLWLPVARDRDRLLVRVPELRTEAQAMERDARELEKLKSGATTAIGLRAAIQQAGAASRLPDSALQIAKQDSGRVRATVASAPAEQAFRWVAAVQSSAGVRIESIRFTSLGGDRFKVEAMLAGASTGH